MTHMRSQGRENKLMVSDVIFDGNNWQRDSEMKTDRTIVLPRVP